MKAMPQRPQYLSWTLVPVLAAAAFWACDAGSPPLTAEMPLHLAEHFDEARIEGSEAPADPPPAQDWRFDEAQPDWKPAVPRDPDVKPLQIARSDDALRVTLTDANRFREARPRGGIYVDLPNWVRDDWAYVVVRARTSDKVRNLAIRFNLNEEPPDPDSPGVNPFLYMGDAAAVINDGAVQTYLLRADWSGGRWEGPWRQLCLWFFAEEPGSIDVLSVSVIPKEANYAAAAVGAREEVRNNVYRRSLYTHAPGSIEYRVRVPEAGRLDLALGVLREDNPVTFRVSAGLEGAEPEALFEETYSDKTSWAQRSVDLAELSGQTVTLALEADADVPGTVALWGAPVVTGAAVPEKPNVIFYVIDGAGADYMSVYGYNRRTTPNIERLAAQGAVFERAYSNSSWTKPSTASFMTSLQHSVLGGYKNWNDPVPEEALTMAEHFGRADYLTGVFVANPNAGTLSNLQRGVDVMREGWEEFAYFGPEPHKESSRYLHEAYWRWREAYPGAPYWVHFQTTDVHEDFPAITPFSGLYVGPEQLKTWRAWNDSLRAGGGHWIYGEAFDSTGISRVEFFTLHQGLYDETMAHNDYQLGKLVQRLKEIGQWENTLLIIAADHSTRAAMDDMGIAIEDSLPPRWSQPILRASISRVPLIFVWPGHIEGGQRIAQPVSMIDVLPTVLDLAGLPLPEVMMGQSLAPLMMGGSDWEPRPVILDQFQWDQEDEVYRGLIEVVDGRWGASLEINPEEPEDEEEAQWQRPMPLLLYDLWNDPMALNVANEEWPELVEHYTEFLEGQWAAHQALAQRFTREGDVVLTPEQLRTLRALGYIQ